MMDGGDDVSGIMMSAGSIGVYCFLTVICHLSPPYTFHVMKPNDSRNEKVGFMA